MQLPKRKPGKYTQFDPDPVMSQKKFESLKAELDTLYARRPHAAKEVGRLAELGDFSENVEYQLAKRRLRGINSAIIRLEHQLEHAKVLTIPLNNKSIQVGHIVTLTVNGKEKEYMILGSTEADPLNGVISYTSPIGKALLGKKVGDTFTRERPDGTVTNYTILSIKKS